MIGKILSDILKKYSYIFVIGTTDFTHAGPGYLFMHIYLFLVKFIIIWFRYRELPPKN